MCLFVSTTAFCEGEVGTDSVGRRGGPTSSMNTSLNTRSMLALMLLTLLHLLQPASAFAFTPRASSFTPSGKRDIVDLEDDMYIAGHRAVGVHLFMNRASEEREVRPILRTDEVKVRLYATLDMFGRPPLCRASLSLSAAHWKQCRMLRVRAKVPRADHRERAVQADAGWRYLREILSASGFGPTCGSSLPSNSEHQGSRRARSATRPTSSAPTSSR